MVRSRDQWSSSSGERDLVMTQRVTKAAIARTSKHASDACIDRVSTVGSFIVVVVVVVVEYLISIRENYYDLVSINACLFPAS